MSTDDLKALFHLIADASYLAEKHRWLTVNENLEQALAQLAKLMPAFSELEIQ
ncbi:MAG: hypothetical protein ABSC72_01150 [Methylovirgula sp.]|jgi:hypothetical protein